MKSDKLKRPPYLGKLILRKIYGEELFDEIYGDFLEVFQTRIENEGRTVATLKYLRDAILSVRNADLKEKKPVKHIDTMGMIKSYFKMTMRILLKYPSTSLISIFGFAIAVACMTTSFLFADFVNNLDSFHTNRENIYQIISHIEEEGEDVIYGPSPMLLAEHLKTEHSDVIHAIRLKIHQGNVRFGDRVFRENLLFTDPSFLTVFDFPIKKGDKSSLNQKQNIMLSEDMVSKYFGNKNPIGQPMTIKFPNEVITSFVVSGVFSKSPENATFKTDIVLPISNYFELNPLKSIDWTNRANATFVLLKDNANPNVLSDLMDSYQRQHNEANPYHMIQLFEFFSLDGLGNQSDRIFQPVAFGSSKSAAYSMMFIGLLFLILACFNYLNIAVSSATKRIKEIAVRKVMGGARRDIIYQFLMENIVICGFSIAAGALLCYYLFLPGFNIIAPVDVSFSFSTPWRTLFFYLGTWLFIGVISGAYPAFYISRYQPSVIFQSKQKFIRKNYFTRALLTLQFFISFTAIVGSFIFTDNAIFVKTLDWGYDSNQLMSIKISDAQQYKALQNIATSHSAVLSTGGSNGHIGVNNPSIKFEYLDKQFRAFTYNVDHNYLKTMKVELLEGRLFRDKEEEAESKSIVINEDFAIKMDWEEPIGQQIDFNGGFRIVIGVISNIRHAFGSKDDTRPMIFTMNQNPNFDYLTIRYANDQIASVDQILKAGFNSLAPDDPYDRIYQSEIFNRFFNNVDSNIILIKREFDDILRIVQ